MTKNVSMKKIECVIMDWAGTAVDFGCFAPLNAFLRVFGEQGVEITYRQAREPMGLLKIEHIKEEKIWQKEDSKEYYTQLTDTLRTYIKERYGFNAMEMTSFEIIQHLTEFNDDQAISELRELFQTADLVKFAKYSTLINENDRNLVSAIEYINQTKIEETQPQPTEIVVVEKRSRMAKIIFWICIGVAALALAGVISYMVYRIIFLNL